MKQPAVDPQSKVSASGSGHSEACPLLDTQQEPYQPPPPFSDSAVLVRADGTGVCYDGTQHTWKTTYPLSSWLIACLCLACCGPLYCYRHPQHQCANCGTVIVHPASR